MTEASAAVVVRTLPLGEADVVVVLHTERWGKVRTAARSARKSRRRFAGGLAIGSVGTAEVHATRGALWRLDGFVPRIDHGAIGRDLDRFAFVAYLCELTDALVEEHHTQADLHHALEHALVSTIAETPDAMALRRYEIALLHHLGLLPAFADCCVCGAEAGHEGMTSLPFDSTRGGVLCPTHGRGAEAQPAALLRLAEALHAGAPFDPPTPLVRRALRDLLLGQIRGHLRQPLRSVELFAHLVKDPGQSRAGTAADGAS
jgi:DNA repair protein RecO (recombination protein O)